MLNSKTIIARRARKKVLAFGLQPSAFACSGFTMVEIAICLAIIGIALIAIIGVLPLGINVQKDNREETLINQDASVFLEAIRNGTRGLDDLTNYVYFITNNWTQFQNGGVLASGFNTYSYNGFTVSAQYPTAGTTGAGSPITNGLRIIGLLSTPEYMDYNGAPTNFTGNPTNGFDGFYNHVVAYVRSLSGPAVEKPPQTNETIRSGSFSYKILCDNVPMAAYTPPFWQPQAYNVGDQVFSNGVSWVAILAGNPLSSPLPGDVPGYSDRWRQDSYPQQLTSNLRELRLTFLWPLLPAGNTGNGRHTFATTVAGQLVRTNVFGQWLYLFQPQTFSSAP